MRLKLRSKLIVALIPVLLVPVTLLGVYYYQQERNKLIAQVGGEMQVAIEDYHTLYESRLQQARKDLELLSQSHLLRQYFLIENDETRFYMMFRSVLELFKGFQQSEAVYKEIMLLNNRGQEEVRFTGVGIGNATENESGARWFQQLQQDRTGILVQPVTHPDYTQPMLLLGKSIPLSSYADWNARTSVAYGGYLIMNLSLPELHGELAHKAIGENGFLVVLDDGGKPLHLSPAAARFAPHLAELPGLAAGNVGPRRVDSLGERFLVQSHPLSDGHVLYAVWPQAEARALGQQIAWRLFALITIVTLTTAAAIVLLIHQLVEIPIRRLKQLALQLSEPTDTGAEQQNLDFSSFTRKDEIADLARAFHTMADNLNTSHQKLHQHAFFDNLTGLFNRPMFHNVLTKAIAHAQRQHQRLAVLFIDVDGFKDVNDTLGHDHGDIVLQEIARRLHRSLRESDVLVLRDHDAADDETFGVARFGGDEFSVILTDLQRALDARHVAERILQVMAQPFSVAEQVFHLSASIGIALFPDDGSEAGALLKNADIAMYQAKAQGKNQFEYFDPSMTRSAFLRHQALNELREALESRQLCLYYQPQVRTQDGELIGCEALIRWQHPVRGMVSPAEFIPLAEESGLIVEIGRWVLEEACRQNREWQEMGLPPIRVAVNFSTVQFNREANIATLIQETLARTGLDAQFLDVEITETGIMQSRHVGKDRLLAIKRIGVTISMDDFGTGYSSLASLRDFPLDKLKVDKSFVDAIASSDAGSAIMNAILAMARELGLKVVAEGVETDLQRQHLQAHACEFIQGYLISRPLPAHDMTQLLQRSKSTVCSIAR